MHAWGLRLRRVLRTLAIAHPPVLPSAMRNDVGTLVAIISQLNTLPACAPVNASMAALRLAAHDSGSGWFATSFPVSLFHSQLHSGLSRRTPHPLCFSCNYAVLIQSKELASRGVAAQQIPTRNLLPPGFSAAANSWSHQIMG
jgi:hypothetical protein